MGKLDVTLLILGIYQVDQKRPRQIYVFKKPQLSPLQKDTTYGCSLLLRPLTRDLVDAQVFLNTDFMHMRYVYQQLIGLKDILCIIGFHEVFPIHMLKQ